MEQEDVTRQLQKLTDELTAMLELVQEAYIAEQRTEKRYNMGVMVGIGYAYGELKKIVNSCSDSPNPDIKGRES